ncbi:hypothetical protein V8G54_029590 [Vigna mungo]|uniref:K+ potassium transporter integral membrane domain-containing protein n=1 Tax=Vigna mungo TaxID=3915 RepID=A0AAQ3MVI2_VIGMU
MLDLEKVVERFCRKVIALDIYIWNSTFGKTMHSTDDLKHSTMSKLIEFSVLKLQEFSKKTVVIFLERDSKRGVFCAYSLINICTKKAWQPVKRVVIGLASCEECWLHVQIAEEGILAAILPTCFLTCSSRAILLVSESHCDTASRVAEPSSLYSDPPFRIAGPLVSAFWFEQRLIRTGPRIDSFNVEALEVPDAHRSDYEDINVGKKIVLAIQTLGVVFGDVGTSPLYTFSYVLVVLWANDDGKAGTFALYSLIYRHAKLPSYACISSFRLKVSSPELERSFKIKERLENSLTLKKILLILVLTGTFMVIANGVVTPAMSVLSSAGGLKVGVDAIEKDEVLMISVACLVILFSVQKYGTSGTCSRTCFVLMVLFSCLLLSYLGLAAYLMENHVDAIFLIANVATLIASRAMTTVINLQICPNPFSTVLPPSHLCHLVVRGRKFKLLFAKRKVPWKGFCDCGGEGELRFCVGCEVEGDFVVVWFTWRRLGFLCFLVYVCRLMLDEMTMEKIIASVPSVVSD